MNRKKYIKIVQNAIAKAGGSRRGSLSDVLLAIESGPCNEDNATLDGWRKTLHHTVVNWNLRKDDLTEQSDECISFLAELLNPSH